MLFGSGKQNRKRKGFHRSASCHENMHAEIKGLKKISLVGAPNVGKSVIFGNLTGMYANVSNYPGTTVEVSRGKCRINGEEFEIIDTPGMYSLIPLSEEERVARNILLNETMHAVVHIIDAKNLDRMIPLTLQMIEAGLPLILVLNMTDECEKAGIEIDAKRLSGILKIPVIPTTAVKRTNMAALMEAIASSLRQPEPYPVPYDANREDSISQAVFEIGKLLGCDYVVTKQALSLLLLQKDREIGELVREKEPEKWAEICAIVEKTASSYRNPLSYKITLARLETGRKISISVTRVISKKKPSIREFLDSITMNPVSGSIILILVLYFGLYIVVGKLGAGVLVDFLEKTLFLKYINPFLVKFFETIIPWQIIRDIFTGDYGIFTLGLRYAIGIILPIVTVFFLVFAVIEDSGYLPRLAMLIDRVFKTIGLSGRAVIPMVLGLGCDTMATLVTRTLPTKRERLIATFLLSLAIPCSAQLGVIFALLGRFPGALLIWASVIGFIFLASGIAASKITRGQKPVFYMELPPMRFPSPGNVLIKTISRVEWYLKEIIPIFLIGSILIWLGQVTGFFAFLIHLLVNPLKLIGLPPETAPVFLLGFFRRDYGAAGLYDLQQAGVLNGNQVLIACIVLTLFLPCIAQFMIIIKERGTAAAAVISLLVLALAFLAGLSTNALLNGFQVIL